MSRQDVENAEKQWLDAFNADDPAGVAALYTGDARLLPPNSDIVEGRADIQGFIAGFTATKAQISFKLIAVEEGGDLSVAVGRYEMDIPTPDGTQHDSGKYIEVWKRQGDGSWLMIDDIFNSSLPAPA